MSKSIYKSTDPGLNTCHNENIHCFKIYQVPEKYLTII